MVINHQWFKKKGVKWRQSDFWAIFEDFSEMIGNKNINHFDV